MSSSESDVEIKRPNAPKKVRKKTPSSPSEGMLKNQEARKATTKEMIHEAILYLTGNSRKGVSLYAIKKYMVEKYSVDVDRMGFLIRKTIKTGIEDGSILQTKGIGVSGSFRMSAKKTEKKKKVVKEKTMKKRKENAEKSDKNEGKKTVKRKVVTEDTNVVKKKKTNENKTKTKVAVNKEKTKKKGAAIMTKTSKNKEVKILKTKGSKTNKVIEIASSAKKKSNMMKRKSIGSIIKPPKMRPKARE